MAKQFSGFYNGYPTSLNGGSFDGSGGFDTSDATATADDILKGKIAYGKDGRIVGTHECNDISCPIPTISNKVYDNMDDLFWDISERYSEQDAYNDDVKGISYFKNVSFATKDNSEDTITINDGLYLITYHIHSTTVGGNALFYKIDEDSWVISPDSNYRFGLDAGGLITSL